MSKTFMGVRLRKLRAERGMTQVALAHALGLSPSYLNQIEQNQRPLTVPVLLRISKTLGVDVQQFSEDDEARLVASMREALADNPGGEAVALPELREIASQMPAVARALLALHRRHQEALEQLEAMAAELGDGRGDIARSRPMPFEVVRDFFFANQNHFAPLDLAAESLAAEARAHGGPLAEWLQQRLMKLHGVRVVPTDEGALDSQRRYEPASRVLRLAASLEPGQQAFQLATQLALLEQAQDIFRDVPHYACLDTAFHQTMPARATHLSLPKHFAGEGVVRYGFHGLSYESIVASLGNDLPERLVVAHLGSGASLCAIHNGRSIDTTMGLTPTGGIPMATRTGELDPGVFVYLMRTGGLDADTLEHLINKESGLKGLSDSNDDMQALLQRSDADAELAIDIFCTAVRKTIGAYAALMGGLDRVVFTGGIGEHASSVRERICQGLEFLHVRFDVIETQEEKQIARHCRTLLTESI